MFCLAGAEYAVFNLTRSNAPNTILYWGKLLTVFQSFFPLSWLIYALTFARQNGETALRRWRPLLGIFLMLPLLFFTYFWDKDFIILPPAMVSVSVFIVSSPGYLLTLFLLLAMVIVLMNLEQTFRASEGLERLKIKYMMIGSSAILGLKIYEAGQVLLYSLIRFESFFIQSLSLIFANVFIFFFVVYRKLFDADLFVSHFILLRSATLLLTGAYMFFVGLMVFGIRRFGGDAYVNFIPILIFIALLAFVILYLSEKTRVRIKTFIFTHFYRSRHDFRVLLPEFSEQVGTKLTLAELIPAYVSWLCSTFETHEAAIWLLDSGNFVFRQNSGSETRLALPTNSPLILFLDAQSEAVVVADKQQDATWLKISAQCGLVLRQMNGFVYVPIRLGHTMTGFVVLGRKIAGFPYDAHDVEFLATIAKQSAGQIERVRLGAALAAASEMHTFHTLSSFFVHDLKNHAATLSFLAQNALELADNPEFQRDAFKTIQKTANDINQLINNVSLGSKNLVLSRSEVDLNQLIEETLDGLTDLKMADLRMILEELPKVLIDKNQIATVIRNLLINAKDAIDGRGEIRIETRVRQQKVLMSIIDNGCGMSTAFIENELFKPLHTTKPSGWGIGLFQCQQIVEAHGGRIVAKSKEGEGSNFTVELQIDHP